MASRFPGDKDLILYVALIAVPIIVVGQLGYRLLIWLGWI